MKTPLQVIADFGCPTDSVLFAIKHLSERNDLTLDQYKKGIQDIIGLPELPEAQSYFFAKVLFRYIIQETIRAYNLGIIPIMDDVYEISVNKANVYIEENPWSATAFNLAHGLTERDEFDENGQPIITTQKGAKKEVAERLFKQIKSNGGSRQDIIDAFITETGMSKAGSTTYFHSLKKQFGFKDTPTKVTSSNKAESKQQLAERLYTEATDKSKPVIIALFQQKLETSKLGAQTYYYSCKKKLNAN